jgi:hypothetical protein
MGSVVYIYIGFNWKHAHELDTHVKLSSAVGRRTQLIIYVTKPQNYSLLQLAPLKQS